MVQRFIRLLGWLCYTLGAGSVLAKFTVFPYAETSEVLITVLIFILLGRGIIYVAVGPRRNPF